MEYTRVYRYTGVYRSLLEYIGVYWSKLDYIGVYIGVYWRILEYLVYWTILKYIGVYWSILEYIGVYWSILEYIGLVLNELCEKDRTQVCIFSQRPPPHTPPAETIPPPSRYYPLLPSPSEGENSLFPSLDNICLYIIVLTTLTDLSNTKYMFIYHSSCHINRFIKY